jgi:hypothetical protein
MADAQQTLRETIPLDLVDEEEIQAKVSQSGGKKVALIISGLLLIALVVTGLVLLLQPGTDTARVRDIFIIIIQLARLILLLQNEIKPILDSTNETANTLRGTTAFLSEHLVEPVLKLNQYMAGLNRILSFFKSEKD